jgi:hypothetical protein
MKKLILLFTLLFIYSCQKDDIFELIDDTTLVSNSVEEPIIETTTDDKVEEQPLFEISVSNIEMPIMYDIFEFTNETLKETHGSIYYTINNNEYILYPGRNYDFSQKTFGVLFKKVDNQWTYLKSFVHDELESIRNVRKIDDTTYVMGEASENLEEAKANGAPIARPSHIYLVKLYEDDVTFTRISTTPRFFHDVSYGDINQDGLYDIVATDDNVFLQNADGSFTEIKDVYPEMPGGVFFSIEVGELFGDSKPEIVRVSYIMHPWGEQRFLNSYHILNWNNENQKFDLIYETSNPRVFHQTGDMGGNHTRILDINKDGNNDILIGREGNGGQYGSSIEIWLGDGNGGFEPSDMITNENNFWVIEWRLMDANNDGLEDIIIVSNKDGSIRLGPMYQDGFRLNDLIYLNNGDGTFSKYLTQNLEGGVGTAFVHFIPYMKNGNLTFFSTHLNRKQTTKSFGELYIYEVELKKLY